MLLGTIPRRICRRRDWSPSFWGSYERLVIVNGFSKAYGLPGLRIGWIIGPKEFKAEAVRRQDHTLICPSAPNDYLATAAFSARESKTYFWCQATISSAHTISDWDMATSRRYLGFVTK
jgi:aspartate/methionine/tyrosine aminotransferase